MSLAGATPAIGSLLSAAVNARPEYPNITPAASAAAMHNLFITPPEAYPNTLGRENDSHGSSFRRHARERRGRDAFVSERAPRARFHRTVQRDRFAAARCGSLPHRLGPGHRRSLQGNDGEARKAGRVRVRSPGTEETAADGAGGPDDGVRFSVRGPHVQSAIRRTRDVPGSRRLLDAEVQRRDFYLQQISGGSGGPRSIHPRA